jgi:CRISPR/Cas system-associated exonuclease Cas4 (RecB family)
MTLEEQIKLSFFNLLERPRTPKSIHVSALPFCLRKEFFGIRFNASPTPVPAMISGKIHHLAIQHLDYFKLMTYEFEKELHHELKDGYTLSGRADAILADTVYEFKFTKRLDSEELDPLYFTQTNAYACMADCEYFVLVKVHRDSYDVKVLEGEADKDAFEMLKQRALMLIDCLEQNVIPNGPELAWECKNCVYNIICSNLKDEQRRLEE